VLTRRLVHGIYIADFQFQWSIGELHWINQWVSASKTETGEKQNAILCPSIHPSIHPSISLLVLFMHMLAGHLIKRNKGKERKENSPLKCADNTMPCHVIHALHHRTN
jgi:hypothetical protein